MITSPAMMEVCEVIDKFPDERSPVVMEDYMNDECEDIIRKYLVEKMIQKKKQGKRNLKEDRKERYNTQRYY